MYKYILSKTLNPQRNAHSLYSETVPSNEVTTVQSRPPETAVVAKTLTGLKQKYSGNGACSGLRELANQSRESWP